MKTKLFLLSLALVALLRFSFAQSRSTESIGITDIIVIELADNGDVWAGSATQGVAFYQASSNTWAYFDSLTPNSNLRSNSITGIALSQISGVPHSFIGTMKGGVITQSGGWDTIPNVSGIAVHGVAYRQDSLWVITPTNFVRFDSSFNHIHDYANPHPGVTCVASGQTQCAGFWMGTTNSGAFFTSNGTLTDSINSSNHSLINNHVNAVAVDVACNRVFIGTQGGFSSCPTGGPPCQNYTTSNGLPQNDVTAVVVGCNNNIWLGTKDSGVVVYNTQSFQFTRVTTQSNQISALACAKNCVTYVGSPDGSITQVDSNKTVIKVMTGVRNIQPDNFSVNVFPLPSGNEVNFVFEKEITTGELLLTDISGRTVEQFTLRNNNRLTADISPLANGIYFYWLMSSNQLLKTGKLEVVH